MSTTPKINTVDIGNGSQELSDAVAAGIETFSRLAALKEADEEKAERERETGEKGKIGKVTTLINLIYSSIKNIDAARATGEVKKDLKYLEDNIALLGELAGELPPDDKVYRAAAAVTQNAANNFITRTNTTIGTRDDHEKALGDINTKIIGIEGDDLTSEKLGEMLGQIEDVNNKTLEKGKDGAQHQVTNSLKEFAEKVQFQEFLEIYDDDQKEGLQIKEAEALTPYIMAFFEKATGSVADPDGNYVIDEGSINYSTALNAFNAFTQNLAKNIITRLEHQIHSENSSESAEAAVVLAKVTGVPTTVSKQWDQQKAQAEVILSKENYEKLKTAKASGFELNLSKAQRIAYETITNDKAMDYKASFLNKAEETIKADDYDISKEITRLTQKQRDYLNDANDKIQAANDARRDKQENTEAQNSQSIYNRLQTTIAQANNALKVESKISGTAKIFQDLWDPVTNTWDVASATTFGNVIAEKLQDLVEKFGEVNGLRWAFNLEGDLEELSKKNIEKFKTNNNIETTGEARRKLFTQKANKWLDEGGSFVDERDFGAWLDVSSTTTSRLTTFKSLLYALRVLDETGYSLTAEDYENASNGLQTAGEKLEKVKDN